MRSVCAEAVQFTRPICAVKCFASDRNHADGKCSIRQQDYGIQCKENWKGGALYDTKLGRIRDFRIASLRHAIVMLFAARSRPCISD